MCLSISVTFKLQICLSYSVTSLYYFCYSDSYITQLGISAVLLGLGRLSIKYLTMQHKAIFYKHLMYSYGGLLHDVS